MRGSVLPLSTSTTSMSGYVLRSKIELTQPRTRSGRSLVGITTDTRGRGSGSENDSR